MAIFINLQREATEGKTLISLLTTRVAAIGGCGAFALIMAALHILRPDLPPHLGTARAMLNVPAARTTKRPLTFVYVTALSLFVLGAIGMPLVSGATGLLQRITFATALLWALHCATR